MARWTQNMLEVQHIARVSSELGEALSAGLLMKVRLTDGREFEGILGGMNMGNDAGTMKPVSSYDGELMLRTIDHRVLEIDLLDIQGIHNLPSRERLGQYEQAGVIEFVDLPKG